eukprot:1136893-Pelagomonas_calceolata.AAC.8
MRSSPREPSPPCISKGRKTLTPTLFTAWLLLHYPCHAQPAGVGSAAAAAAAAAGLAGALEEKAWD